MTAPHIPIPGKIARLHAGEEELRKESIAAIEADSGLSAHLDMIERAMDLLDYFIRQHKARNDDEVTIQLLGIRVFNGSAASLKLLFSGYYQASVLQRRDILETVFLLHYLQGDRGAIAVWQASDKKARIGNGKFAPKNVRKALDRRYGHTEQKRGAAYALFSELAGHATPVGFEMLRPTGMDAHCGAFFERSSLVAVISELGRLAVQAGEVFSPFFPTDTLATVEIKLRYLEGKSQWAETFYDKPFDRSKIDKMRALFKDKFEA